MLNKKEWPQAAATARGPVLQPQIQDNAVRYSRQGSSSLRQEIVGIDLAAVVEDTRVKLTGKGGRYPGCCPFHPDKNPSFFVYQHGPKWRFKCFGCGAGG